ncbi:hypothetical protein K7I13_03430 [Brucepastera parasyntrophica]|uniref:tetratricopeptide repeat protein n=1 Tax=Brucepastera parasyntrophica TaxID=2880008 RepID=UPI00210B04AD|nr:hypothetical protein [Brucepastera parasyntrophica]ULQ60372.1 hypothetical protein K7I13_03430 [Brucepastera parasyntrophica]
MSKFPLRLSFVFLIPLIWFFSCKTVPEANSGDSDKVTPAAVSNGSGTLLTVPSKEQLQKNTIDSTVLSYLETGSPASIRHAVERINLDPRGMTDQNRVALAVAAELMRILYPLEKVTWSTPSVPDTDAYISAIRQARLGIYDYSSGNNDFFSLVLPSLVLFTAPQVSDFYSDAEVSLKKAAIMNAKSILPVWFLAVLAERQGFSSAASGYYRTAWERDQTCYPAGVGYAGLLIKAGNGATALEIGRQLHAKYPDSLQMVQICAEAAFVMSDWDAADPYILDVLKAEPGNTNYVLMRARVLVERKEYLKANSLLDAFATTNRTNKTYLLLRARVSREWNKNPALAISFLQDAQRLYPDDPDVLLVSAEVSYQTGQAINGRNGRDFVQAVLAKDPGNKTALMLLASDYIAVSDWPNAVRYSEQLVSAYPEPATRSLLLQAYIGSGQNTRALQLAEELYNAPNPADEITSLYLQALINTGNTQAASSLIRNRLRDASSSLKSVLHYYESKLLTNEEEKLSALRSSLLADPRNLDALFAMYEWYFDRKDYRKAQYYLKQVIAFDPMNIKYSQLLINLEDLLAR